jgi:hypothetical protein
VQDTQPAASNALQTSPDFVLSARFFNPIHVPRCCFDFYSTIH